MGGIMALANALTSTKERVEIMTSCGKCGAPYDESQLTQSLIVCEHCGVAYIPDPDKINYANLTATVQSLQGYQMTIPDLSGQEKIRKLTPGIKEAVISLYNLAQNDLTVTIGASKYKNVQAFENIQLKREDGLLKIIAEHLLEPYYPETIPKFVPRFSTLFIVTAGEFETDDYQAYKKQLERGRKKGLFSDFWGKKKEPKSPEPQKEFRIYAEHSSKEYVSIGGLSRTASTFEIPCTSLENFMEKLADSYPAYQHTVTQIQTFLSCVQGLETILKNHTH